MKANFLVQNHATATTLCRHPSRNSGKESTVGPQLAFRAADVMPFNVSVKRTRAPFPRTTLMRELRQSTAYDAVHHTPLGCFCKVDCSTTKRVPIPNDMSRESFRRDVSRVDLFGTGSILTVEISTTENRPRGG